VTVNDSTVTVQVENTNGVSGIEEGQYALLQRNATNGDTLFIGSGKCSLISQGNYYFSIRLNPKNGHPQKNDLIYTMGLYPTTYKGRVYNMIRQNIFLQNVYSEPIYSYAFSVFGDKYQEESVIDSMVADIRFTAAAMEKQAPEQNLAIESGRFKDRKLFDAMRLATAKDVTDFIDYIIARPKIYAGNEWKISEVFATWQVAGTPTVIKD
jgi:hypothetical protein